MGVLKLLAWFLVLGTATSVGLGWWLLNSSCEEVPELPAKWWGRGKQTKDDETITKFKIDIPQDVLTDLKSRLAKTKFSEPLEDATFRYGFNANKLQEVVTYWRDKYDWRKTEKELNKYPHYRTQIDGIMVHFIRVKPENAQPGVKVIPILMSHGWPGSFIEFYRVIPELTKQKPGEKFVFEVIVPSLPGYGFSEAAHKEGFHAAYAGRIFDKLMQRLGFNKYYIQGGDWGSAVCSGMAVMFPERIVGLHLNAAIGSGPKATLLQIVGAVFPSLIYEKHNMDDFYPIGKRLINTISEMGYFLIQATKPDTVGAALQDSPAGLAAYILEKFSTGTNHNYRDRSDGGLTEKFTMDQLLDDIMIYWVTGTITSSQRFYKENMAEVSRTITSHSHVNVPTGIAQFPYEISYLRLPRGVIETRFRNITTFTEMPRGGHFAAYEEPQLLADDVWKFVSTVENKYYNAF
jgi:pimeloyl-ACP methyl ester carboxylesterase